MLSWKKRHTFTEGMEGREVVWFEEDYVAVRDGQKGHTGHLEVETYFDVIIKAVEKPNEVRSGKKDRNCYYAWFSGDGIYQNQHMKVVIEQTWYGVYKVVTAFFTPNFGAGEQTIWPPK